MIKYTVIFLFLVGCTFSFNDSKADIIIQPVYDAPQDKWLDPNHTADLGEYFRNKHGLLCENIIYQVEVNSMMKPARRCRLPNGAWQTFLD